MPNRFFSKPLPASYAALLMLLTLSTGSALAQASHQAPEAAKAMAGEPAADADALAPRPTNRIGDATTRLLQLQASGRHASSHAYPVSSDVAQRTYARYLKSFTHEISESSSSQVGKQTGR